MEAARNEIEAVQLIVVPTGKEDVRSVGFEVTDLVLRPGAAHNGDGQLIYPGPDRLPLSSIRLENLRDGIEDYEYFRLLRDAVEHLKKAGAGTLA